jgi:hypothetical protein
LTVAYEDPVLRGEGLAGDRLGDVLDFFKLTERDAHTAFCSCHLPGAFDASYAAGRVRALIRKDQALGSRVWAWFALFSADERDLKATRARDHALRMCLNVLRLPERRERS